jgi:ankyrin repeat protein
VNEKESDGTTALMVAADKGNPDIVRALLAEGADVNEKTTGPIKVINIISNQGKAIGQYTIEYYLATYKLY